MDICNGTALILDCKNQEILYTITSSGLLFNNVKFTIQKLKELGYDIFIASSDRTEAILELTHLLNINPSHSFLLLLLRKKERLLNL